MAISGRDLELIISITSYIIVKLFSIDFFQYIYTHKGDKFFIFLYLSYFANEFNAALSTWPYQASIILHLHIRM